MKYSLKFRNIIENKYFLNTQHLEDTKLKKGPSKWPPLHIQIEETILKIGFCALMF